MPRPTPSTKAADGGMRPSSSPRWDGLHGNGSSALGGSPPTSLRGGTAAGSSRRAGTQQASSPRALSLALGSTTKPGSSRDQQQGSSRGTAAVAADAREWTQSGLGGKAPKAVTGMGYKEEKQDTREDAGRIRVAVRASTRIKYFIVKNLRKNSASYRINSGVQDTYSNKKTSNKKDRLKLAGK